MPPLPSQARKIRQEGSKGSFSRLCDRIDKCLVDRVLSEHWNALTLKERE